ncbi:MAG: glycine cleavage system protein GcvH [Janthinobacterium lividum]
MNIPADLKYTESHEWIRVEADGSLTIGITDHAQEALGDIVFLELPAAGKQVSAGDTVAVVESVKAASDIYAPVSGEIVAANDELSSSPERVNSSPYESWLYKLKPSGDVDTASLLSSDAYAKSIGA